MCDYNDYFRDEYIIKTEEKLNDNYKVIIHTYDTTKLSKKNTWNYTQGILYNGEEFIGSIKRNYSYFPYTFFKKQNKTYFISGSSYMCQTIIDCKTGQVYDNATTANSFIWTSYYQIDENTLCVSGCYWGGPCEYRFFDMTDPSKGWPELKIDKSLRRYSYVLFKNDVGKMKNYSYPIIEDDKVIFTMRETRIKDGDIDMEYYNEYEYQDYYLKDTPEKIVKIEDPKSKIYYVPRSRLALKRVCNTMKLIEFWRSEQQIEEDKDEDVEFDNQIENKNKYKSSDKYKNCIKLLTDKYPKPEYKYRKIYSNTYCNIYVSKDNKTYIIKFRLDNDLIELEHYNWKNSKEDLQVSNINLENIIDLIKF